MKITLGGLHVDAFRTIEWHMTTGVLPYQTVLEVAASEGAFFLSKIGEPLHLTIEDLKPLEVDYVFVLGEVPASTPFTRAFLISDRRWRWSRKHMKRSYNIRRRTGDTRLETEGKLVPLEVAQNIDEYFFAPYSTDNGTKWTAKRSLEDFFDELQGTVDPLPYEFRGHLNPPIALNDVEINDPAPAALAVLLKAIPGTDLYVDLSGKVIIFNTLDGSEKEVVQGAGSPVEGSGFPKMIDLSKISPSEIVVYVEREIEVRFDTITEGSTAIDDELRLLENVVPITDPSLVVDGKTVAAGTWVGLEAAIAAWNTYKDPGGDGMNRPDLTLQTIREGYLTPKLYNLFTLYGNPIVDPIWVGRIGSLRAHFRKTYRVPRKWMDRARSIKAHRAAILDVTTGTRALARVYSDYCVKPSIRARITDANARLMGINYFGYNAFLADAKISPAYVQILDDQVGIVHLDYRNDLYGMVNEIIPSAVLNIPTIDMSREDLPHTWGEKSQTGSRLPTLYTNHRAAIVFTMIPASPNGLGQYHAEVVKPEDAQAAVTNLSPVGSTGPRWELFVGPEILTARVAWKDSESALIEQAFGINNDKNKPVDLSSLTINLDDIKAVARAVAATVWKRFQTRVLGEKSVRLNPEVPITGSISSVEHGTNTLGHAVTRIRLAEELADLDPLALLPASTRATILREVPV